MGQSVVGILGGMGPAATVDLMQRLIDATPARDDVDHLRVLVDNNPKVPSRIAALLEGGGDSPAPTLIAMARGLQAAGADLLAMPCNTAHHYYDEVAAAVDIPFIDLREVVASRTAALVSGSGKVGLLASSAVLKVQLFEPSAAAHGLGLVYPGEAEQTALMALIREIKAGTVPEDAGTIVQRSLADLSFAGADIVAVACTELSVLSAIEDSPLPFVDAAQLLAEEVLRLAL